MKKLDDDYIKKEQQRHYMLREFERQAWQEGFHLVAGVDEVGRGAIAGPVVTAAVIMPEDFFLPGVNDSKKLTARQRIKMTAVIKQEALAWACAYVFPSYLDKINILNATKKAMQVAVENLYPLPDIVLSDAVKIPDINIKQVNIIKGDELSISIACASIVAKVERDKSMEMLAAVYPGYGFEEHKGYATKKHVEALLDKGPCRLHRASFEPVKSMLAGGQDAVQPGLF